MREGRFEIFTLAAGLPPDLCTNIGSLSCILVDLASLRCHIELEVDDVTVDDFVVASILSVETLGSHFGFRPAPVQVLEFHHFGADEATLEVSVDHAGGLGGLGAASDGPAFDLVLTSGEVVDKLKCAVANVHDLVDHRWRAQLSSSGVTWSLLSGSGSGEHLSLELS